MNAALDTLSIAKRLKDAGFSESQAEAVTGVLNDSRDADLSRLATKDDLKAAIEILRRDLTIRLGGMIVVATGVLLAAKFFG